MPPSAAFIPVWCGAVRTLEQMVAELQQTGGSCYSTATTAAIKSLLAGVLQVPAPDVTELEALVVRLQVPRRIGTACSTASSMQHQGPLSRPVLVASYLISRLTYTAIQHRSQAPLVLASFWQQLEQAGFIALYPELVLAVADKAAAVAAAAAAAAGGASVCSDPATLTILRMGGELVDGQQLSLLCPVEVPAGVAFVTACLQPVLQLVWAAMKLLSATLPPPPPPQQQQQQHTRLRRQQQQEQLEALQLEALQLAELHASCLQIIHGAARVAGAFEGFAGAAGVVCSALLSPRTTPGVALLLTAQSLAVLCRHTASPAGSFSSINSASASASYADQRAAWEQVVSGDGRLQKLLTPCDSILCSRLGVSPLAVLWAATTSPLPLPQSFSALVRALSMTDGLPNLSNTQMSQQELQQCRTLLMLTVSSVMHAASRLPDHPDFVWGGPWESALRTAAGSIGGLIAVWCEATRVMMLRQAQHQDQEQQQHQGQQQEQRQQQTPFSQDPWLEWWAPPVWLQQVLDDVLQLGSHVLKQLYPQGGAAAAGNGAGDITAATTSSSSSSTSSTRQHAVAAADGSVLNLLLSFLGCALHYDFMCWLAWHAKYLRSQEGGVCDDEEQQQQQLQQPTMDIYQVHTAQLLAVAEGVVRHAAATLAAGRLLGMEAVRSLNLLAACLDPRRGALLRLVAADDGSSTAQEELNLLCSLLCSMCKLGSLLAASAAAAAQHNSASAAAAPPPPPPAPAALNSDAELAQTCFTAVVGACSVLLQHAISEQGTAGSQTAMRNVIITAVLLWQRALMGCMSLHCKQQQPAAAGDAGGDSAEGLMWMHASRSCAGHIHNWLQDDSVAAELSAAGYQPQQLVEATQQLLAALDAASPSYRGEMEAATISAVQAACKSAADATSAALSTTAFCNNPACANVAGPSEVGLVSGRSCICGGCRIARYCSQVCQHAHWKQHRRTCKALAAAAAAAAAGGGGGGDVAGGGQQG